MGSKALGSSGIARIVGYVLALGTGFVATSVALVLIYRIFPPKRLPWKGILRATLTAATGISVLSFLFLLYVSLGANFEKHYATSGLASLVLLAVWLFLANVLLVTNSRTPLVVIPILLLLFACKHLNWRGIVSLLLAGVVAAALAWSFVRPVRSRATATEIPATGLVIGTPASIRASDPAHALAIDEEPFDSRMSLITLTV